MLLVWASLRLRADSSTPTSHGELIPGILRDLYRIDEETHRSQVQLVKPLEFRYHVFECVSSSPELAESLTQEPQFSTNQSLQNGT